MKTLQEQERDAVNFENLTTEDNWIKEVRKAAKKSCDGNQHTHRYNHMLDQFIEGAKWQRDLNNELLTALIDLVSEIEAMPGGEYFDLTKYYQAIKKAK